MTSQQLQNSNFESKASTSTSALAAPHSDFVGPAGLEELVEAFPGFISGREVNGGDLVDWMNQHRHRFVSSLQQAHAEEFVATFPGFQDDGPVDGGDLVDWINSVFGETFKGMKSLVGWLRTSDVAIFVEQCGGDLWGECSQFPKEDWIYAVRNGDTVLGYWEWVMNEATSNEMELSSLTAASE